MKPKCKLCGERHWTYEPHVMKSSPVTDRLESVTRPRSYPTVGELEAVREMQWGGARQGAGRKRVYKTAAARQAAYRSRKK